VVTKAEEEQAKTRKSEAAIKTNDDDIQRKLAYYTLGLLIVGFLQSLVLAGTVWAVIKQTNAVENSERAWLLVENVEMRLGQGAEREFYPVIVNFGKTIARIKKVCGTGTLVKLHENLPDEPDFRNACVEEMNFVLYPKGQIKAPRIPVSRQVLADNETGLFNLYLYGFVEYEDFSGRKRYSGFCLVRNLMESIDFRPATKCPHSYNKAT
jgi:hypothetical protein